MTNNEHHRRPLSHGADVNARDNCLACHREISGRHVIVDDTDHYCVRCGALERGTDVNVRNDYGNTPFHEACRFGHPDIVRLLLEKGAKVNARRKDDGHTPLHEACMHGHVDAASLLIEKGAKVNAKNTWGATPFHAACATGELDLARLLLEHGADLESRTDADITALHWACMYGHPDIVRLLIEKGADVNARDEAGRSPLDLALELPTDNPAREEILDLFRQYAPEQVMEAYCTQEAI
ncbi:MAG: Ankyrin repeat protein [Syntrophorhabdus sp. PtaB.Bin047]|jgi:ankyrin repeat protein|nr:MAG: Ankyrin repeat protein [Syntrophorhabdus sp. PtaB.Bin047]